MMWSRDDRGAALVTTAVIAPLLLIALAGVLQLGALRVTAARLQAAADLAALIAVNDQDDGELARSGVLQLTASAAGVARDYFGRELALSGALLDDDPARIAAAADIAAFPTAPAFDPHTGLRYARPAVRIAAVVPVRTPMFGALLLSRVTAIPVLAVSTAR
jgi:Flp pilus assembly protein TadG